MEEAEDPASETVRVVGRGAYGVVYLCVDGAGRNYITKHIPVSDMAPSERLSAMNEVNIMVYDRIIWRVERSETIPFYSIPTV